jgi:5'-deoxynucleotidase YfbR-like HD superfamily hydrolase
MPNKPSGGDTPTPLERAAGLYEQSETAAAQAVERLVGSGAFGSVLAQLAENAAAITKLGSDATDLVLRNLRVAGRRDIVRLSRQLARTEDKLERVLQELEGFRDEAANRGAANAGKAANRLRTTRESGRGS